MITSLVKFCFSFINKVQVRVGILLTYQDRIISLREEVWAVFLNLNPCPKPKNVEVMCLHLGVPILLLVDFRTIPIMWYFFSVYSYCNVWCSIFMVYNLTEISLSGYYFWWTMTPPPPPFFSPITSTWTLIWFIRYH